MTSVQQQAVTIVQQDKEEPVNELQSELNWLYQVIELRLALYLQQESSYQHIHQITPPHLSDTATSFYASLVQQYNFGFNERLALTLALAPYVQPQLLDLLFLKNATYDRRFTEFGGIIPEIHSGFLPTGETLAFIIGESDLTARQEVYQLLHHDHPFHQAQLLSLTTPESGEPHLSGQLQLRQEVADQLSMGYIRSPQLSSEFPAKRITTELTWDDLVLAPSMQTQLTEIQNWVEHKHTLYHYWGFAKKLRPGMRVLFYGPPGTGKTMTASLLGKHTNKDVYRIDLSAITSKYIGETEKNLARIFDLAENREWILFFDEADALFGKRSDVNNSNDRYANQEVAYLLQRIEGFSGLVILATNMKDNIDQAFLRRFELVMYFSLPSVTERLKLWQQGFSSVSTLADDIDLPALAEKFEITGSVIMNVIAYSSMRAIARGSEEITSDYIIAGMRKEYSKLGKTF